MNPFAANPGRLAWVKVATALPMQSYQCMWSSVFTCSALADNGNGADDDDEADDDKDDTATTIDCYCCCYYYYYYYDDHYYNY